MPKTSDTVIVSAAGDSEVRIFDVSARSLENGRLSGGSGLRHVYTCHRDRVKRIAVDDRNPFEFLTCSEDGTVRHFDLRRPHICSHHTVRSFLLASHRPARSYPNLNLPPDAPEGCPSPLLNYYPYDIDINTISLNKLRPEYFAVGGMDTYIYLHDRRMIGSGGGGAGRNPTFAKMSRCIRKFANDRDSGSRRSKHVTACKFSDANGQELLGSWSSDGVYLFNMNDSPIRRSRSKRFKSSSKRKRSTHESSAMRLQTFSDMKEIVASFKSRNAEETIQKTSTFIENQHMNSIASWTARLYNDDQNKEEVLIRKVWGFGMEAASRGLPAQVESPNNENSKTDSSEALRNMMLAEHIAPKTWRGLWCLAVSFWLVGHGNGERDMEQTSEWIQKARSLATHALELYTAAKAQLFDSLDTNPTTENKIASESEEYGILDGDFQFSSPFNMMESFLADMKKAEEILESLSESTDINGTGEDPPTPLLSERLDQVVSTDWVNYMYIFRLGNSETDGSQSPGEGTSLEIKKHAGHASDSTNHESNNSGPGNSEKRMRLGDTSEEADEGSSVMVDSDTYDIVDDDVDMEAASLLPSVDQTTDDGKIKKHQSESPHNSSHDDENDGNDNIEAGSNGDVNSDDDNDADYGTDSDDELDNDSDDEWIRIRSSTNKDRSHLESDVDVIGRRAKYVGHCNKHTVKDVNFFGPNDEYVVSGSDEGNAFFWDKKTTRIVQILKADDETVNVIQGHPYSPVVAISGIDNTVKIFEPNANSISTSPITDPTAKTSYPTASRMWQMDEIVTRNQQNSIENEGEGLLTRSMLAVLSARLTARRRWVERNGGEAIDEEDDDETEAVACEMQ
ncbi:WD40-repeat-containing domain protein [Umbelopsis sp. PMI_123]|nr:WD40-repeat-containing domain protein [Umbelopsis sp. PMI_123]